VHHQVKAGVIRSAALLPDKLIVTANAEVAIRSFREADRPQLERLWSEVFPDDPPRSAPARMIDGALAARPESLLVAELGDVVVGAVIAGWDGVRGWIYHLAVAPARRRRGIATGLVRAAEATLRALGCPKINLQVRATNQTVVAFYRALGYQIEERVSMGRALD
jgi:ribosomal protein S18 acetylase RimI-like enzyme